MVPPPATKIVTRSRCHRRKWLVSNRADRPAAPAVTPAPLVSERAPNKRDLGHTPTGPAISLSPSGTVRIAAPPVHTRSNLPSKEAGAARRNGHIPTNPGSANSTAATSNTTVAPASPRQTAETALAKVGRDRVRAFIDSPRRCGAPPLLLAKPWLRCEYPHSMRLAPAPVDSHTTHPDRVRPSGRASDRCCWSEALNHCGGCGI